MAGYGHERVTSDTGEVGLKQRYQVKNWGQDTGPTHSEYIRQATVSNVVSCYCWVSRQSNSQLAIKCASDRRYEAMQEKAKQ